MTQPPTSLPRRLLHRVPVRVRHHWVLLVTCASFLVVCAVLMATVRVAPLVTSASDSSSDQVTADVAGTRSLFEADVPHSLTLTFRDADYQRLLDDFWTDGEKTWLEADLTVDGTLVPSVGIRLKGNSTLAGLTRGGQSRPGGFGPPGGGGPGGFGRASLKAEEPETLPWLIRFDEFVEGRRYQGHREIAVRVAGMGGGTTVLNEAVALDALATAGQTAQGYAYAGFTVNGRPTTARLVVETPDERFAGTLAGSGVLYKSLATSRFSDQGDDPTAYADDFQQITMKGSQDLQPVIGLIRWVNTSSDAEFAAHLAEHVDVPSFARYLAAQNLLLNFDDMGGPGRNYYLWYDLGTKRFTVVGWDYNLTFSGSATQGPHDTVSMGGGFPGGGEAPQGFQPPDGLQLPDGFQPPEGMQPPDGGGPGGPGGGFGGLGGNKLKERFLAGDAFRTVYDDAYRELYRKIYGSGAATGALDDIADVLSTVDGYDAQATSGDVEQLRSVIRQRTEHLATDSVVTGR
jgi:spore coat protein CotH